jgi:hypothetical protein
MVQFFKALGWLHQLALIVAGIWFFWYCIRTRFWFPRYVHWMAAVALLIGVGMVGLVPESAPINRSGWGGAGKVLFVLVFPALVYVAFVFFGGQHAAYQTRADTVTCPHCRSAEGLRGTTCATCGQPIP